MDQKQKNEDGKKRKRQKSDITDVTKIENSLNDLVTEKKIKKKKIKVDVPEVIDDAPKIKKQKKKETTSYFSDDDDIPVQSTNQSESDDDNEVPVTTDYLIDNEGLDNESTAAPLDWEEPDYTTDGSTIQHDNDSDSGTVSKKIEKEKKKKRKSKVDDSKENDESENGKKTKIKKSKEENITDEVKENKKRKRGEEGATKDTSKKENTDESSAKKTKVEKITDEVKWWQKPDIAPEIRKREEKWEAMRVNKRLGELAQRKHADSALELFEENYGRLGSTGKTPLKPSVHAFTNLVNAFVRVSNVIKAGEVIEAMKKRQLEPNVVTKTTFLRGLCENGHMAAAKHVIESMNDGNERSSNTYLRGLLKWGMVDEALEFWKKLNYWEKDKSTREYVIKALAIGLRAKTANKIMREDKNEITAASMLAVAEAELLLNHPKKCKKLIAEVKGIIPKVDPPPDAKRRKGEKGKGKGQDGEEEKGEGTPDENVPKAVSRDEQAVISLKTFLSVQANEAERQRKYLKSCLDEARRKVVLKLDAGASNASSSSSAVIDISKDEALEQAKTLRKAYASFFYFRPQDQLRDQAKGWKAATVVNELKNLGCRAGDALHIHQKVKAACIDSRTGHLSLNALDKRPLKLEIGSGNGEWLVQKAQEDTLSQWAAVELRFDRCAKIWSRMCLEGVKNMCVLGGNAHDVISSLESNSIAEVVSLYPEPPAWHQDDWDPDTPHVWTSSFLEILGDKLQPGGELRICSDNGKYMELIASFCPGIFEPLQGDKIQVLAGKGLDRTADSYFDRLFKAGRHRQRFHLHLRKM